MEEIELVRAVGDGKPVHHQPAHVITVFNDIFPGRLTIVVLHPVHGLVGNIPTGKEMHLVVLFYQRFCEVGCSIGEAANPLCIHRFPAEKGYFM